jgi:hypothetical protein
MRNLESPAFPAGLHDQLTSDKPALNKTKRAAKAWKCGYAQLIALSRHL